ncbi:MAG TPA: hypothetical protein VG710_11725 [Opitutus sp.]|nr:hypothetical protein [Opitutus sp.]
MSVPDQTSKLPKLPFLIGDVVLLAAAWYIASRHPGGLHSADVAAITTCVAVGAVLGVVPFLADYARKQDELLDDRQRALEALARTVTSAAEQISIAAGGFNEIAELAHKNLRQAETLPHKLQEKIAEFNAQLDNAREDDREELEKELTDLRAAESERLAAVAAKVEKAVAELTRLDADVQKQVAARSDLVAGVTDALAKASAAAIASISDAQAKALAAGAAPHTPPPPAPSAEPPPTAEPAPAAAPAAETPSAPKRPRKPRPEPVAAEPSAAEPPPVAFESIPKIEPVAPHSAPPFPLETAAPATASPAETAPEPPAAPAEEPKPVRKRAAKKPADDASADLPLEPGNGSEPAASSDDAGLTAAEVVERVLASDGATRLIATAYIGIGNRLFIRGDGPGLSWDKGVPLQFVSIGKWRWETPDAAGPVKFKLFKNDETECTALGTLTLDPGYQQEVTAKF